MKKTNMKHMSICSPINATATAVPMRTKRRARCMLALCMLLGLCSGAPWISAAAQDDEGPGTIDTRGYRVQPGDVLHVSVWKEEGLDHEVLVRPDGGFSFPLAGDINAVGKTVEELRQEIADRLARYIPGLVVTVSVRQINGNKIYVLGQVNNPGEFVMNPRIDVMQALSIAGGTTAFASTNDIFVLRRDGGRQVALPFRFDDVVRGRNLEQNILLESGDVVVVP